MYRKCSDQYSSFKSFSVPSTFEIKTFLRYRSHSKKRFRGEQKSQIKFWSKQCHKLEKKTWVSKLCGTPVPGNTAKALANAVPVLTDMDWSASTTWTCAVNASGSMPRILDSRSWINCKQYVCCLIKQNKRFLKSSLSHTYL